jgi:hypothetical protein
MVQLSLENSKLCCVDNFGLLPSPSIGVDVSMVISAPVTSFGSAIIFSQVRFHLLVKCAEFEKIVLSAQGAADLQHVRHINVLIEKRNHDEFVPSRPAREPSLDIEFHVVQGARCVVFPYINQELQNKLHVKDNY